jgi:hypothetical protein
LSHTLLILKIYTTFKDVQIILKRFLKSLLVSDFRKSVWSVPSISLAVLEWKNGQKLKNHQKCWIIFLSIFCHFKPKSEKLVLFIQKASIINYRCHSIKNSYPKKLVWKSFLTLFYNLDHCAVGRMFCFL